MQRLLDQISKLTEILNLKVWNKVTKTRFVFSAMTILLRSEFGRQACSSHHPSVIWIFYWFSNSTKIPQELVRRQCRLKFACHRKNSRDLALHQGPCGNLRAKNFARVRNCPDITILNPLFGLFTFLYFCYFVFLSFCLFVFLYLSFCLDITLIKCLKGLKPQKSLIVSKL